MLGLARLSLGTLACHALAALNQRVVARALHLMQARPTPRSQHSREGVHMVQPHAAAMLPRAIQLMNALLVMPAARRRPQPDIISDPSSCSRPAGGAAACRHNSQVRKQHFQLGSAAASCALVWL